MVLLLMVEEEEEEEVEEEEEWLLLCLLSVSVLLGPRPAGSPSCRVPVLLGPRPAGRRGPRALMFVLHVFFFVVSTRWTTF